VNVSRSAKTGSSLVATLFFVSVLLGLLLILVVLTRIRSDSGALDRNVRLSRRAIQSGLALALADIEDSYLVSSNRVYSLPDQEERWVSSGTGGAVTGLVEEVTAEWLGWPDRLRGLGEGSLATNASHATWVVIGDPSNTHMVVAWVGVDLTGLLDPNLDQELIRTDSLGFSGETNQWFFTAREFALSQSTASPFFVPGAEVIDEGYYDETLQEWLSEVEVGAGAELVGTWPGDWTTNQVEAVMSELFPDRDAGELAQAFDDYWNAREVPTDPEALTAVAVPMLNEASATVTLFNNGSALTISNRIDFEVWYPFPGNVQTNLYRMPRTPELLRTDTAAPSVLYPSTVTAPGKEFVCPTGSVDSAFMVLRLDSENVISSYVEGQQLQFEWNLEGLELERADGSGVVDRLPAGMRLALPPITVPASGAVSQVEMAVLEVEDPRLNHIPDRWVTATETSLFAINAAAQAAKAADGLRDEFVCWVPSPPSESDPEESPSRRIAHFPIGEPWLSFDLFGSEGRWWMRHTRESFFTVGGVEIGVMNPNSRYPEALATVFEGQTPRQWPGETGTSLTYAQGLEVAEELEAAVLGDQGFVQRGDWNWAVEAKLLELAAESGKGRHAAESMLVETLPLLNTRSQLWGLIVLSETRGPAGQTLASSRRMYRISRDPFENPDGRRKGRVLFVSELPDPNLGF